MIAMTTSTRSWGGDSVCSEWLKFVSQGAGPKASPIRARLCTVVFFQNGGDGVSVAVGSFVLYAGGDYALHLNIMLLVQVMDYVMSGTFAHR